MHKKYILNSQLNRMEVCKLYKKYTVYYQQADGLVKSIEVSKRYESEALNYVKSNMKYQVLYAIETNKIIGGVINDNESF